MHAGVLEGLERAKIPVSALSVVSGGAIIGSFYAAGGDPHAFLKAVEEGRFNLKRDIGHVQNAIPLLLTGELPVVGLRVLPFKPLTRVDVQANLLDSTLFHGLLMDQLDTRAPSLIICATDLQSGALVGFFRNGMLFRRFPPVRIDDTTSSSRAGPEELLSQIEDLGKRIKAIDEENDRNRRYPGQERLAKIVAMSGAFPIAFNPYPLPLINGRIADGGLLDNSGITMLLEADSLASFIDATQAEGAIRIPRGKFAFPETARMLKGWNLDLVLGSDASAPFVPRGFDDRDLDALRATDTVYSRVGPAMPRYRKYETRSLFSDPRTKPHPTPVITLSAADLLPFSKWDRSYEEDERLVQLQTIIGASLRDLHPDEFDRLIQDMPNAPHLREVAKFALEHDAKRLPERLRAVRLFDPELLNDPTDASVAAHLLEERKTASGAALTDIDKHLQNMEDLATVQLQGALAASLGGDVAACLNSFLDAGTLQDHFAPRNAEQIFYLGRYLTLLNFTKIRDQLRVLNHSAPRTGP